MWYEILPTYLIITAALSVPNLYVYWTNKLLCGQPFKRKIYWNTEYYQYCRDAGLSKRKWAYDYFGLENIPDKK